MNMILKRIFPIFLLVFLASLEPDSSGTESNEVVERLLFSKIPKVALVVNEHYVDPSLIDPEKMLISMLNALELRISKLVVELPDSLKEKSLKKNTQKDVEEEKEEKKAQVPANKQIKSNEQNEKTEKLVLKMGEKTASFEYEPLESIWGLIFFFKEIVYFVEDEIKKQEISEKSKAGVEKIDIKDLEVALINAMLSTLDPHSDFYNEKNSSELSLTTKGEFGGIGIYISYRDGFLTVISPVDNTPAHKAGMKANDKIIEIEDQSAINMDLNEAVDILRGKPGTIVRLTVQRPGVVKPIEMNIERSIIKVESVSSALLDNKVGYLRIKSFQGKTTEDVKTAILAMKKESQNNLSGLVLDLRDNPGGLLSEAISLSGLFLDGGEVVSTKGDKESSVQMETASKGQLDENLKIVVLINEGSASASEIIAGALKYRDRSVVVGNKSFGKGSVQLLFNFPSEVASKDESGRYSDSLNPILKLTIAQYFVPGGRVIQTLGITPDIELNEVKAGKADEIRLFPEVYRKESDLDAHLSVNQKNKEKPVYSITYLGAEEEQNEVHSSKLDLKKLKDDFAVKFAWSMLGSLVKNSREEMLSLGKNKAMEFAALEEEKIINALKKYEIDWSVGEDVSGEKKIAYSIVKNKPALAGTNLEVTLKVKNISNKTLYRVHGLTKSDTTFFNNQEFIFGKLKPNEEKTATLKLEIPKETISRRDYFTVQIRDYTQESIDTFNVPLSITGLKRSRLAYTSFILSPEEKGKSKTSFKAMEDINFVVWLKNLGDGSALEPTVLLRNKSGNKVFLRAGRETSDELKPNKQTPMKFSFKLKEPCEYVDFELQLFDKKMRDVWRDKIRIPTKAIYQDMEPVKQDLNIKPKKDGTKLLSYFIEGEVLALLKSSAVLKVLLENKEYYLIKVNENLTGLVKKSDVSSVSQKIAQNDKSDKFSIVFNRVPPRVSVSFEDNKGVTFNKKGRVLIDISGGSNVNEVLLYVNTKKVLYKNIKNYKNREKLTHEIELVPGVNNITVLAREDDFFGESKTVNVFYDENKKFF